MEPGTAIDTKRFRERLATARRTMQECLGIVPSTFSTDGRSFVYQGPLTSDVNVGGYVRLHTSSGISFLGRIVSKEVETREGPEISLAGDASLLEDTDVGTESQMAFRLPQRQLAAGQWHDGAAGSGRGSVPPPGAPNAGRYRALATHFADLPDPRIDRGKRHDLLGIVTIDVCGVICGADTWADIARFGYAKRSWLETLVPLPRGILSHDTFGVAALDPMAVEAAVLGWVQTLVTATDGTVVAIDGTTARHRHDRSHDRGPRHLVSAWAAATCWR